MNQIPKHLSKRAALEIKHNDKYKILEPISTSKTESRCYYCGNKAVLHDHYPPLCTIDSGPTPSPKLLIPACYKCNQVAGTQCDAHIYLRYSRLEQAGIKLWTKGLTTIALKLLAFENYMKSKIYFEQVETPSPTPSPVKGKTKKSVTRKIKQG